MAISYVGGTSGSLTASTGSVSLNGTLTGGSNSSPSPGDLVVVYFGGGGTANFSASLACSGNNNGAYTGLTGQYANDTFDTNVRAFYDLQGSTVDTQINLSGLTYSAAYGNAVTVMVFRGVDPTTPLSGVTPVYGTVTNASTLSFAAITPNTAGSWIIFGGGNCQTTTGAAITLPSAAHSVVLKTDGTTSDFCAAVGSYESWTSGAYTPTTATGGTTSTSCSAARIEFVIKPEPPPVTGSLSVSETGADAFTASGDVQLSGAMAASESGADNFAASGSVSDAAITGNLAASESGSDTFSATGEVTVKGSAAATETGSDTFTATGTVPAMGSAGSMAAVESGADAFASPGTVLVKGALTVSETGSDNASASGKVVVKGTAAGAETGSDTATATGKVIVSGSISATEESADTLTSSGTVSWGSPITGSLDATESATDSAAATGSVAWGPVSGSMAASEGVDGFAGAGVVVIAGSLSASETGDDSFAATGGVPQITTLTLASVQALAAAVWAQSLPLGDAPTLEYGAVELTPTDIEAVARAVWSRSLP